MAGVPHRTKRVARSDDADALAASLRALDAVLTVAVDRQARLLGPASLLDPWRGMHLEQADVQRLLGDGARAGLFRAEDAGVPALLAAPFRGCRRIAEKFDELHLSDADVAAMVIVLAPVRIPTKSPGHSEMMPPVIPT